MLFNSYAFIAAFLPLTVIGFWLALRILGRTCALAWLLLASIAFYAVGSLTSLVLIAPSILFDWAIARSLLQLPESRLRLRRALFACGIVANIAFLGYFKYKNFFLDSVNTVLGTHFELHRLLLPLGISFLVFQKIAFLADVQSGAVKSVRLSDFLLFSLFFPRTIAGPIIHYQEVMPQFERGSRREAATHVAVGICLFSIGLFKKSVIADSLAQFVTPVFDPSADAVAAGSPGMLLAWEALLAYAFQLYFDFSGYSDMALGAARMVGVRLPLNFNSPFKASSMVEFWSRWHVTLTRFLTTYIYTPIALQLTRSRLAGGRSLLSGKRSSLSAVMILVVLPTLTTMIISGLWHGAGWQFILWGALHGVYLSVNQGWRLLRPRFWRDNASYQRIMRPVGCLLTFISVVVALAFFRADSVAFAFSIVRDMAGMNGMLPHAIELLEGTGVSIPWRMLNILLPSVLPALLWILALLVCVMQLPNSLELLRRFHPAVDFPEEGAEVSLPEAPDDPRATPMVSFVDRVRVEWTRVRAEGVSLSPITATVAALLCVLGAMALNRSVGFLYGAF